MIAALGNASVSHDWCLNGLGWLEPRCTWGGVGGMALYRTLRPREHLSCPECLSIREREKKNANIPH